MNKIIFWEPCISPHKHDFMIAVSNVIPNIEIICCAAMDIPDDRKKLGWVIQNKNAIKTIIAPSKLQIKNIVCDCSKSQTIHIFSGIRHISTITTALNLVRKNNCRFAIMSEPRAKEGWKGKLRYLESLLSEGWLRNKCEFILAIGANGSPWFKSVGYSSKKIHPFAYFIDVPTLPNLPQQTEQKSKKILRIGYIGRLVTMKGIFDLIEAIKILSIDVVFVVAGSGHDEEKLKSKCKQYGIFLDFRGVVPIHSIGALLLEIDILVLASLSSDGWGVVVSEALMSGVPVIATPCVGASLMLNEPLFGRIVSKNNPQEIANKINDIANSSLTSSRSKLERQTLARCRLSAEAGAYYFKEILDFHLYKGKYPEPFFTYSLTTLSM